MKRAVLLFLFGCSRASDNGEGKPSQELDNDDTAGEVDTDTGDTARDTDTAVDTALAEEIDPFVELTGTAPRMLGVALDEGDIDGDHADDLLLGAPGVDPDEPETADNPGVGMAYLMSGPIRDGALVSVRFHGIAEGDAIGIAVAHGDFNGDGGQDVAIGGGMSNPVWPRASGFVAVSYGPFAADVSLSLATILTQDVGDDAFGSRLAVGDIDDDGVTDLVVGAPNGGADAAGAAYVYRPAALDGSLLASFTNGSERSHLGAALAVGDVDGDGQHDVLIGAPTAPGVETAAGAAYLFLGPNTTDASVDMADATLLGEVDSDCAGTSLDLADMDNDGHDDLLVGAPDSSRAAMTAGVVYVIHGPLEGSVPLEDFNAIVVGAQPGSNAGEHIAYANDVNGDGAQDMLVGAPGFDDETAVDAGRGYLVLGPVRGWMSVAEADYVVGPEGGRLGDAVLADTELTGDTTADFVFGAPRAMGGAGQVYLMNGFVEAEE